MTDLLHYKHRSIFKIESKMVKIGYFCSLKFHYRIWLPALIAQLYYPASGF